MSGRIKKFFEISLFNTARLNFCYWGGQRTFSSAYLGFQKFENSEIERKGDG